MSLLYFWETQRSVKRRKTSDLHSDVEEFAHGKQPPSPSPSTGVTEPTPADEPDAYIPSSQTDLETSLPAIKTEEDAVEEYEALKTDDETESKLHVRLRDGVWQKGKSSIYVDAFNLALETVLGDESHLFHEAEMEVFRQWKELSYESQYLYVFCFQSDLGL
jgi:Fanconi-associated nuclease 1